MPQNAVAATGSLKNFNTIEDFKNADKTALFNAVADEIWSSIAVDKSTALLNRFLVITFADLKKYKYFYWFAFPAFVTKPAWEIDGEWAAAESVLGADSVSPSFFVVALLFFMHRAHFVPGSSPPFNPNCTPLLALSSSSALPAVKLQQPQSRTMRPSSQASPQPIARLASSTRPPCPTTPGGRYATFWRISACCTPETRHRASASCAGVTARSLSPAPQVDRRVDLGS